MVVRLIETGADSNAVVPGEETRFGEFSLLDPGDRRLLPETARDPQRLSALPCPD